MQAPNDTIITTDVDVEVDVLPPSPQALVSLQIHPRAEVIKYLAQNTSTNHYGLPEYIFRSDLLPHDFFSLDSSGQNSAQEAALLELDYSQGYATLPNGETFWNQMPHESAEDFRCFHHFLGMPRQSRGNEHAPSAPVRQLNLLKPITGKSSVELLSLSYQYYWPERARAYDLFMVASHQKQKELRTQNIEDKHFERAQRFVEYAETYLEEVFADPEAAELTPKEAFDMMHKMMMMQRLSVGLSPNGAHAGKDENKTPANASLEVIMRTIAKNAGIESADQKSTQALTQELFKDPDNLYKAQELIIRMGDIKNPRQQKRGDYMEDEG